MVLCSLLWWHWHCESTQGRAGTLRWGWGRPRGSCARGLPLRRCSVHVHTSSPPSAFWWAPCIAGCLGASSAAWPPTGVAGGLVDGRPPRPARPPGRCHPRSCPSCPRRGDRAARGSRQRYHQTRTQTLHAALPNGPVVGRQACWARGGTTFLFLSIECKHIHYLLLSSRCSHSYSLRYSLHLLIPRLNS